jgi:hypothetical protein
MSAVELPGRESWRQLMPNEALVLLSTLGAPWWVCGGWALDLHLGTVTRVHKDLDIGICRQDAPIVAAALPGWQFFEAKDGALSPLSAGDKPRAEVNSLWCKRANATQWEFELLLDRRDGEFWIFRRDPRITRPFSDTIRRNSAGIPYLAPEIQLLYKARAVRPQDQMDFDRVVPHLAQDERGWLRQSLMRSDPEHVWIAMLQ